jgi:hypothetical protein
MIGAGAAAAGGAGVPDVRGGGATPKQFALRSVERLIRRFSEIAG